MPAGVDFRRSHNPIAGLLLALLTGGCAGSAPWPDPVQGCGDKPVYVISHGWHTGIAIAAENLGPEFAFLKEHVGEADWYEFGWGDRKFYRAKKVTLALTLRAALWPTDAVLHVAALSKRPDRYFAGSRVVKLTLEQRGHRHLLRSIAADFQRNDNNKTVELGAGLYGVSRFFEARGRFHVFHTCNTWTAATLKNAGIPVRSFLTVRAASVINQLEDAVAGLRCQRT